MARSVQSLQIRADGGVLTFNYIEEGLDRPSSEPGKTPFHQKAVAEIEELTKALFRILEKYSRSVADEQLARKNLQDAGSPLYSKVIPDPIKGKLAKLKEN